MDQPVPRVLADLYALADDPALESGARWRLAEAERQLDANLVHLPAGRRIDTHVEPDLDVVLVVVAGDGIFGTAAGPQHVAAGNLVWLPHGASRDLTAGASGLSYLTVHRRRPGLRIKSRPAGA
jgi:quercetin dioxygenase-like cupin family protein